MAHIVYTQGPAHRSDRYYWRGALRVKEMAEAWRSSGRPTLRLNPKINQVRSMYYSEATVLEESFLDNSRFQGFQQLLPSRRLVVKFVCNIHDRIIRRLRPTPRLADPWSGEFSLDLPMELFSIIAKKIIEHNSHGHTMSKAGTTETYTFSTFGKAKYGFARMNLEGVITQPEHLIKT